MAGLARWAAAKFAHLPPRRTRRPRWTDACASVQARRDGSGSPIVCGARATRGIGPSPDSMIGGGRGSVDRLGPPPEPDPVAGSNRGRATTNVEHGSDQSRDADPFAAVWRPAATRLRTRVWQSRRGDGGAGARAGRAAGRPVSGTGGCPPRLRALRCLFRDLAGRLT